MLGLLSLLVVARFAQAQVAWPASGPEVCAVPSTLPIRPDATCADFGHGSSCEAVMLDVAGQRGEIESAQLLLRHSRDQDTTGGMRNVTVRVSGLPDAVASVDIFQVGLVETKHSPRYQGSGGSWRPDPLLAMPPSGFDVAENQAQGIWMEVHIKTSAAAGIYNATVEIGCASFTCDKLKPVPMQLTVWESTIPTLSESKIGTAWSGSWTPSAFRDYYGDDYWSNATNKHAWYDALIRARTPPDAIYQSPSSLRPVDDYIYLASQGVRWFAILDVTSLPLSLDGTIDEKPVQRSVGGIGEPRVAGSCANYTDEYVSRLIATLGPIMQSLEKAGISDRAYIYGFDENPRSCEPQVRKLFGATKAAFPKLTTSAVLNWSPMPVDLPVDVWILQYQEFKAADAKTWSAAGKVQWQYHCIEPHSLQYLNTFIERRPIQPRLLFWLAAMAQAEYGAPNGWLYYAVNLWRPCKSDKCGGAHVPQVMKRQQFSDPADPRTGMTNLAYTDFPPANFIWQPQYDDIFANGDGQYLYPCEEGPCGTTRLSAIRDGLEDWELFSALGSEKALPLLKRVVRSPTDWTEDAALLESVRREAARMLMDSQKEAIV